MDAVCSHPFFLVHPATCAASFMHTLSVRALELLCPPAGQSLSHYWHHSGKIDQDTTGQLCIVALGSHHQLQIYSFCTEDPIYQLCSGMCNNGLYSVTMLLSLPCHCQHWHCLIEKDLVKCQQSCHVMLCRFSGVLTCLLSQHRREMSLCLSTA